MEEAWKRRIQLAPDKPDADEKESEPAVVITDDIRQDAERLRKDFMALFAKGGETLSGNWNGDEFRESYLRIKDSNSVLAAQINARKQNFTTARREKLVVITAFRLENKLTEANEPSATSIRRALAGIRAYFRKKKDGKGADGEVEEGD